MPHTSPQTPARLGPPARPGPGAQPARPAHQQRSLPRQTLVRPWQATDTPALAQFYAQLGQATLRWRFHCAFNGLSPARIKALTALAAQDPARVQTVVAVHGAAKQGAAQHSRIVAHAGWHVDGPGRAEFALVVADSCQGLGLGQRLMAALVRSARSAGVSQLHATVLCDNAAMLGVLQHIGLATTPHADDPALVQVVLDLAQWPGLRRQTTAQRAWRLCQRGACQLAAWAQAGARPWPAHWSAHCSAHWSTLVQRVAA